MEASLSDAALVARCRTGDENAWAELVNRFSRYVFAIATQGFGLRADDAEDVFQEVFARTYQHLDRLRDDEAIRPWIAQLTRRLSIDRIRAGSREQLSDEDIEPAGLDGAGIDRWLGHLGALGPAHDAPLCGGRRAIVHIDRVIRRDRRLEPRRCSNCLDAGRALGLRDPRLLPR